jgi:hypothetical protein
MPVTTKDDEANASRAVSKAMFLSGRRLAAKSFWQMYRSFSASRHSG